MPPSYVVGMGRELYVPLHSPYTPLKYYEEWRIRLSYVIRSLASCHRASAVRPN